MKKTENIECEELVDFELPLALGKTVSNQPFTIDLVKMQNMLLGGNNKQEISAILNAIIKSLVKNKNPSQLKFVFIDSTIARLIDSSKVNEFYFFRVEGISDLILKDEHNSLLMLFGLIIEMQARFKFLANEQVRNIKEYTSKFNRDILENKNGHDCMSYIVVLIDEFASLITSRQQHFKYLILRITQLAKEVGIHLIISTQELSSLVNTDRVKSHFPSGIALKVSSVE